MEELAFLAGFNGKKFSYSLFLVDLSSHYLI